ncbi:mannose-1-phosphate guanylyltransferase/mannose-6-phosphate isomerase [Glaciecola sp. HTCC2999]|uniref:mannose-1-phosphate guanylyltransferase/mannose-6-phosphate isomerase n=1 Tax=Glaciecola sp. HTCC2999 TaxID=455436 RepID=UPI0000E0F5F8|nr:mannose-1-phosphate guanylyltransferase/mannose-6-phosphate isomerase [Glaciecola sp. HTCC2999]
MQLVVMAGGTGSRLWPISRSNFPKQFINLVTEHSMLQDTLLRVDGLKTDAPYIICNESTRFLVADELQNINVTDSNIILEPVGRNTAPAIALAAFDAISKGQDPILLVLAADHVIKDQDEFIRIISSAESAASKGKLVTFGVVPNAPETGYGYIKTGQQESDYFNIEAFVEKPDLDKATSYLASGDYLWNSGMFMFKASTYLNELKLNSPDIYASCEIAIQQATTDMDFIRISKELFEQCPDDSIDYAVMEKTENAVVIPLDAKWSDVGSWASLSDISDKDEYNNVHQGDVISVDTQNTYVYSPDRLTATIGLQDLIIVDSKDALLVAHKNNSQDVKKVVKQLKQENRSEYSTHREVHRPWGKYDSIDNGERYQVKRITVKPGAKLSVQMHHHRAEHWIVVSGTAKVTNGDKTFILSENESTYIPVGVVHALENPGKLPLELIEVQSGAYLGEDDIVRFEDNYGRVAK